MRVLAVILVALCVNVADAGSGPTWHTPPDQWQKPRLFHGPFDDDFAWRIQVGHTTDAPEGLEKTFSPNKAYWFSIDRADTSKPGPWNSTVLIHNEREDLIAIKLLDHATYWPTVKWINEKLLHVRVLWGRVLGTDLVFDVEKEQILYREMLRDGTNAYWQWKEHSEDKANWDEALSLLHVGRRRPGQEWVRPGFSDFKEGDKVTIDYEGRRYRWRVESVGEKGVKFEPLDAAPIE